MTEKLSFSVKETSELIGCGVTKVYELLNDGSLRGRKIGKRTIVLKDDLQNFLSNLKSYNSK